MTANLPPPKGDKLMEKTDLPPRPRPNGATVREHLEAGPKFVPVDGVCITCGDFKEFEPETPNKVDKSTGLGVRCWRSWRWSSIRERPPLVDDYAPAPAATTTEAV